MKLDWQDVKGTRSIGVCRCAFLATLYEQIGFFPPQNLKKNNFTSWWINVSYFSCSLGDLPADVDIQTGVWGGGKAVCRQEVSLISTFLIPQPQFCSHLEFCQKVNIFCSSLLTLDSGTHPGLTFVWFFFFFKVQERVSPWSIFLGCIANIYKVSCIVIKNNELFFIYICVLPLKLFTGTSFQFWL